MRDHKVSIQKLTLTERNWYLWRNDIIICMMWLNAFDIITDANTRHHQSNHGTTLITEDLRRLEDASNALKSSKQEPPKTRTEKSYRKQPNPLLWRRTKLPPWTALNWQLPPQETKLFDATNETEELDRLHNQAYRLLLTSLLYPCKELTFHCSVLQSTWKTVNNHFPQKSWPHKPNCNSFASLIARRYSN